MKLTDARLRRLIAEEIYYSKNRESQYVDVDVDNILREQRENLNEGRFTSLAKAIATPLVPGGRFISDYSQARGFDELEGFAEETEVKLGEIESRLQTIESVLSNLASLGRLGGARGSRSS